MMELAGKDIKTAIITMFRCFKEDMNRVCREMRATKESNEFLEMKNISSTIFLKSPGLDYQQIRDCRRKAGELENMSIETR